MKGRNNYKQNYLRDGMQKRGQVAIFVIVAILIVVAGILIYVFMPGIKGILSSEVAPTSFLKSCIGDELKNSLILLQNQGGYANPEGFIMYQDNKVKYLCYTAQYYKTCAIQQPILKTHVEQELADLLKAKGDACMQELKSEYARRGYTVQLEPVATKVNIIPSKVLVRFNAPMTITKGDLTQSFEGFTIEQNSEIYDLIMITMSLIDYEATYGDSEVTLYMKYYPNLKIQKNKLGDGSKVYTVTNVVTKDYFNFASRSLAWPPGYGTEVGV